MPFSLNFYHDQVGAEGTSASALPAAHRLLYVRHGGAVINYRLRAADEATYCDGPLALKSNGAWSEVWRWELAAPNAPPQLHDGAGVLSRLKMSRVITTLRMLAGTRWLVRLFQDTT